MFEISIMFEIKMFEISFSVGYTPYLGPSTDYIITTDQPKLKHLDPTSISLIT